MLEPVQKNREGRNAQYFLIVTKRNKLKLTLILLGQLISNLSKMYLKESHFLFFYAKYIFPFIRLLQDLVKQNQL